MDKNELITHILTLRREKKILEKRVKTFDMDKIQNTNPIKQSQNSPFDKNLE